LRRICQSLQTAEALDVLTRVVPGQQLVEEGVVVRQRLAGGSSVAGGLARRSEVGKLGGGPGRVVLDALRNGAFGIVSNRLVGEGGPLPGEAGWIAHHLSRNCRQRRHLRSMCQCPNDCRARSEIWEHCDVHRQ
jgi:hypothetical protein